MSSKRKKEEDRILREVFGEDYDRAPAQASGTTNADDVSEDQPDPPAGDNGTGAAPETTSRRGRRALDDVIRCPRCSHVLKDRHTCPYCGYNGYIPMSSKQTMRIRLILFPVIIAVAAVIYFIFSR